MARISKAKQLTDRDKNILTDLARCRALSMNQIKNAYWPDAKERTCLERLERLKKAGFIGERTIPGEKAGHYMRIYHLEEKGKRWATGPECGLDRKKVFTNPGKSNEILHQIRTNEIYYRLSEGARATYKIGDVIEIEKKVYKGGGGVKVPDASFIDDEGKEVYVEADVGSYTAKQVREKVRSFGGTKTIWICPTGRKGYLKRHGARGEFFAYSIAS